MHDSPHGSRPPDLRNPFGDATSQTSLEPLASVEPLASMGPDESERMAELIEFRLQHLQSILSLSQDQQQAIQAGDVQQLLGHLSRKQAQIDQLRSVQRELAPMAACPAEQRQWPSQTMRQRCREAVEQSARLQQAILEIDAQCEQTMVQRRDETAADLAASHGASQAARAYDQAAVVPGANAARGTTLDVSDL